MMLATASFVILTLIQREKLPEYICCVNERFTESYIMKPDRILTKNSLGSRWKGPHRTVGRWQKDNSTIIWVLTGSVTQYYQTDSVSTLNVIIPKSMISKWPSIKQEIIDEIENDTTIQNPKSFEIVTHKNSNTAEGAITKVEFDLATKILCGSGVMIK